MQDHLFFHMSQGFVQGPLLWQAFQLQAVALIDILFEILGQIIHAYNLARAHDHCPFDYIFKLTDISRPVVPVKQPLDLLVHMSYR